MVSITRVAAIEQEGESDELLEETARKWLCLTLPFVLAVTLRPLAPAYAQTGDRASANATEVATGRALVAADSVLSTQALGDEYSVVPYFNPATYDPTLFLNLLGLRCRQVKSNPTRTAAPSLSVTWTAAIRMMLNGMWSRGIKRSKSASKSTVQTSTSSWLRMQRSPFMAAYSFARERMRARTASSSSGPVGEQHLHAERSCHLER